MGRAQGRLGDLSKVNMDAHGCPSCPHPGIGPALTGSPTVSVNGMPALRVSDIGMHAACCGPNMWSAIEGSPTVLINNMRAHRKDDADLHCGGMGKLIQGSPNVFVGDTGSTGTGGAGSGCGKAASQAKRSRAAMSRRA
jgi:uncharacterized Zn-binding protein involved in type VI secretion